MKRQISNHPKEFRESAMSTAVDCERFTQRLVELESRRHGDQINAIESVARKIGVGPRSVRRIMNGERKTYYPSLMRRVRIAYLEACHRKVQALLNEIKTEIEVSGDLHGDFALLEAETAVLAAKIERAKRQT